MGVGKGKTPLKKVKHTPPKRGEGPQQEVVNGGTVTEPQEAATDREGTGRLRPGLPPPRVLVLQAEFQDLTPCWSQASEDLTHFDITLIPPSSRPSPRFWYKGGA